MNDQLTRIEQAIGGLRGDMDAMRGDITTMRGDMDAMRGDITTMRGYMDAMRGDITTLRGDIGQLRQEMHAGFDRLDGRIDDTESRLRVLIEATRDDVRILAEHYTPLERRVTALERRQP